MGCAPIHRGRESEGFLPGQEEGQGDGRKVLHQAAILAAFDFS